MAGLRRFLAGAAIFLAVAPAMAQTTPPTDLSVYSPDWAHVRDRDCWVRRPLRALPLPERDFARVCAERFPFSGVWRRRSTQDIETICRTRPIDRISYDVFAFDWSGACKARVVDGRGILSRLASDSTHDWTPDGAAQSGSFENGFLNGFGRSKSDEGSYEGVFVNGLPQGQGRQDLRGEGRYEGGFYDGHFDGHGVETFPNGDVLEGWFVDGQPTGRVVFRSAGGIRLEGPIVLPHPDPASSQLSLSYPLLAVRLNDEGFAVIAFTVAKDGSMKNIHVKFSSEVERLDKAALDYVSKLHMLPGSIAGHAVEMQGEQGVSYALISPIVENPERPQGK